MVDDKSSLLLTGDSIAFTIVLPLLAPADCTSITISKRSDMNPYNEPSLAIYNEPSTMVQPPLTRHSEASPWPLGSSPAFSPAPSRHARAAAHLHQPLRDAIDDADAWNAHEDSIARDSSPGAHSRRASRRESGWMDQSSGWVTNRNG